MKRLFYKEFGENWTIICWASLIMGLLMALMRLVRGLEAADSPLLLFWTWGFGGVFAASGLVSREVGNGTLQFLMSLPVSRRQVWMVKCLSGAGVVLITMAATTLTWWIVQRILFGEAAFSSGVNGTLDEMIWFLPLPLIGFAVALMVSTFVDRSLSAAMISIIICLVFAIVFTIMFEKFHWRPMDTEGTSLAVEGAFLLPGLLMASLWTFIRGESLRTWKRFQWAAVGFAAGIGISIALLILSPLWFAVVGRALSLFPLR